MRVTRCEWSSSCESLLFQGWCFGSFFLSSFFLTLVGVECCCFCCCSSSSKMFVVWSCRWCWILGVDVFGAIISSAILSFFWAEFALDFFVFCYLWEKRKNELFDRIEQIVFEQWEFSYWFLSSECNERRKTYGSNL